MSLHPKSGFLSVVAALIATVLGSPGVASASGGDTLQLGRWFNAIWAIGLFLVLLIILGRYAWKPVLRAIQAREQALRDIVDETERRKVESEELLAQYKERLDAAEQDVARMLERTQKEAEATRDEMLAQGRRQAAVAIAEAERQIVDAKRQALNEIYQNAADLATGVASKIVRKEISPEDHRRLVDEGLNRLEENA